ncbi:hypothetical protein OCS_05846 [Ophiocordyceps sinensis CO18]|uniref:Uncharacterized protein n=1 Tax=Ophiocordyceps sinensis (strain Co18 / CGMCC 3.14243) TaxID=911162 RepID=T5A7P8_OPHSC|nr:hypothetical protein OCS_05846 [Ophiocordyceps sinensis CO18]
MAWASIPPATMAYANSHKTDQRRLPAEPSRRFSVVWPYSGSRCGVSAYDDKRRDRTREAALRGQLTMSAATPPRASRKSCKTQATRHRAPSTGTSDATPDSTSALPAASPATPTLLQWISEPATAKKAMVPTPMTLTKAARNDAAMDAMNRGE